MREAQSRFGVIRNLVCFTPRGGVFLFFSSAVLVTGIVRTDLASLLWASGFLLICLYSLAANNLLRLVTRRFLAAQADSFNLKLPAHGVFPGRQAQASLKLKLPRFSLPGFFTGFNLRLAWQEDSICKLREVLPPGECNRLIGFTPRYRGEYTAQHTMLTVGDITGLTRSVIRLPYRERLTVYPVLRSSPLAGMKLEVEGSDIQYSPKKKQSDNLLEVRKYYPGDDVRKINWKVFARFRELYLRIGEQTSLPHAKLLFIIDPSDSPLVPGKLRHAYIDLLVERAGSLLFSVLQSDVTIWLSVPGFPQPITAGPENREELLTGLARIWWRRDCPPPVLPPQKNLHTFVFTSPGSRGLETLLLHLKKAGHKINLFFPLWRAEQSARPGISLRRLLFLGGGPTRSALGGTNNGAPGQADSAGAAYDARDDGTNNGAPARSAAGRESRDTAAFIAAIHDQAAGFRAAPWRIPHVFEV